MTRLIPTIPQPPVIARSAAQHNPPVIARNAAQRNDEAILSAPPPITINRQPSPINRKFPPFRAGAGNFPSTIPKPASDSEALRKFSRSA
ncbi:hypothetical protein AAH994_09720 [Weeksellaceae bacterium A-14]